jgi:phenylacetate-coenzyme A ligase PaaK-like adenylate-forming protein
MIWNTDFEALDRPGLSRFQGERLGRLVDVLYRKVPFYRKKIDAAGVKPQDIQSIADIARLPFTTKDEMRDVYPYGLLAVDLREIVEIHTSSGTTGKAVVDAYTAGDIEIWAERLRLRPVHRGAWRALRGAEDRRHGDPDLGGQYQATARHPPGFQVHGDHLHPLLLLVPRGSSA